MDAPEILYVAGVEAKAGPELDAWLSRRSQVRLPFTVWRGPLGEVRAAAVGRVDKPPGVSIHFDDTALGISLVDRLRSACGEVDPCVVSLSGRFGALLGDDPTAFAVFGFHGLVAADVRLWAEAARPPECLAIRVMTAGHCARGPSRCATCKELAEAPARPVLLDLCPDDADRAARPVVAVERDGATSYRVYDVLREFSDPAEARAFAERHAVTDVRLAP